jgi:hypothetical protein
MSDHVVQNYCNVFIKNSKGTELLVVVYYAIPKSSNPDNSDWKWKVNANDRSKLSVENGSCYYDGSNNTMFLVDGNNKWGIKINNFKNENRGYVNMEGSNGTILQPWVLSYEPGDITWNAQHGWVKL